MSAPKDAIPMSEENPEWLMNDWTFTCGCGYKGKSHELMCIHDSDTLWCPNCGSIFWLWD